MNCSPTPFLALFVLLTAINAMVINEEMRGLNESQKSQILTIILDKPAEKAIFDVTEEPLSEKESTGGVDAIYGPSLSARPAHKSSAAFPETDFESKEQKSLQVVNVVFICVVIVGLLAFIFKIFRGMRSSGNELADPAYRKKKKRNLLSVTSSRRNASRSSQVSQTPLGPSGFGQVPCDFLKGGKQSTIEKINGPISRLIYEKVIIISGSNEQVSHLLGKKNSPRRSRTSARCISVSPSLHSPHALSSEPVAHPRQKIVVNGVGTRPSTNTWFGVVPQLGHDMEATVIGQQLAWT
ncbi:unnamed protein product [Caenorhabditis auriculariae]|uniref:Uncharacterized protein n=1 Tax=Caenorhabditis auriculariae TaxID=2777116 RepID=A0A8S1GT79_9PELO|nr:unnamed protein product [Caenorhabditis auriculariae]